jgi:putative transposase
MVSYIAQKLKIGKTDQLDRLALASGDLYTRTLVYFWRVVRKKGIWLSPNALMRLFGSDALHSQSAQATIQTFFASLKSWRKRRKVDPEARPPKKRKRFFKVIWKSSAIRVRGRQLVLSNGKDNDPLVISWRWGLPRQVEIGWDGEQYELRAIYDREINNRIIGAEIAGVDLGEIHPATTFDGQEAVIYNGRLLRSKRRYQNKIKAAITSRLDTLKRGSRRWRRLKRSRERRFRRLQNQVRDIQHKTSRAIVSTLQKAGVQTLVIGDVRDIRTDLDYGKKTNQKLHQWTFGAMRWQLSYKWEAIGGKVVLQEERGTSSTCPVCGKRQKPNRRSFRCSHCGFQAHRDAVGAINIRRKYQDCGPVVGVMTPPTRGVRYSPRPVCSLAA